MRLNLSNFRTYDKLTLELPDIGMVRLAGDSGIGKSSVMDAITYALYGDELITNIKPLGKNSIKCNSEFHINELSFYKQKGPELHTVVVNGSEYHNEAVLGVIESKLSMSPEQFSASSYIKQKMKGSLLTLQPAEMIRFIQRLAFGGEDPEIFKEKISTYIKKCESDLKVKKAELAIQIPMLSYNKSELDSLKIEYSRFDIPEDLDALIEQHKRTMAEMEKELRENRFALQTYMTELTERQRIISLVGLNSDLQVELTKIDNQIASAWQKYPKQVCEEYMKRLADQGVYLSKLEMINNFLNGSFGGHQGDITHYLGNVNSEIDQLIKDISKKDSQIKELEIQIKLNQIHSTELTCPHCEASVYLHEHKLQKDNPKNKVIDFNTKKLTLSAERESSQKRLDHLKKISTSLSEVNQMLQTIGDPPLPKITSKDNLAILQNELKIYYENNLSSDARLRQQYSDLDKKIKTNESLIGDVADINRLHIEQIHFQSLIEKLEQKEKELLELQAHSVHYSESLKHALSTRTARDSVSRSIARTELQIAELDKKCTDLTDDTDKLSDALGKSKKIKDLSDQAAGIAVNNIVQTINLNAQKYLELLFPEQGTVISLMTTKINKDDTVRAKMSLKIFHKGTEYSDIGQFSGGEFSRACLAFQLALSDVFNSPILMLDEAFAGTQPELKEQCLEALKTVGRRKLVLIAEHGIEDHFFDEVINL